MDSDQESGGGDLSLLSSQENMNAFFHWDARSVFHIAFFEKEEPDPDQCCFDGFYLLDCGAKAFRYQRPLADGDWQGRIC